MANTSYIVTMLGGLDSKTRAAFRNVFDYILKQGLRLGRPDDRAASENFSAYFYQTTTHATPNTEFSVVHGLQKVPYLLIPVLAVETAGAKVVDLTVTRAADVNRVYLSSSIASAPVTFFLEA